jgi:signal peptidase II
MRQKNVDGFKKNIILLNIILFLAFLVDRLIKWLALNFWDKEGFFVWGSFWETKLFKNYHLSFSLPITYPVNLLIIIPIWLTVVFFLIKAYHKRNFWLIAALSAVALGATSNLIDRLRYGFVVDFINWHFNFGSYPAFNLADILIILGTILLLISLVKKDQHLTAR